jgi:hypothetical protein
MRRLITIGTILASLGLGIAGPAAAATGAATASARRVTIKVVGIDRSGDQVPVFASVTTMSGAQTSIGATARLAPGTYLVSADVQNSAGPLTQSLVIRKVRVNRSETITLDARTARRVRVALGVPGAADQLDSAAITFASTGAILASASGPTDSLYATPAAVRSLCLGVTSRWQASSGQFYDLSGITQHGVPAAPVFRFRPGRLAKVALSIRSGIGSGVYGVGLQPGNPNFFTCAAGLTVDPLPAPAAETDYISPGIWTVTSLNSDNGDSIVSNLRARHFYQVSLGDAVAAPAGQFPSVLSDSDLFYQNDGIFSYPFGTSSSAECCAKSIATLRLGRQVLERAKITEPTGVFQKTLTRSGWYTLTVDSIRVGLQGQPLRGLLSDHIIVTWRFYGTTASWYGIPLTLARYEPAGLSVTNSARAHATTGLRIVIERPADSPGTPVYPLTSVRLQVSGNDGKSWQTVRVTRSGRYWIARIPDPAGGYVSLRSTVTDTHGDSTTETIYHAYAIS